MFRPIGSLPPSVYWRRRLMLAMLLAAAALVALTIFALSRNGAADVASSSKPAPSSTPAPQSSSGASTSSSSSSAQGTTTATDTATSPSSPASTGAVTPCTSAQVTVSAATGAPAYKIGDQPLLTLQVTNKGPANCTQDLADSQVELRVFNGAARVWGSHDCEVQPGTNLMTLEAGKTVGVQIVWSGLSSQPACAGTRQRVGAGTYTLYPLLAGVQGTPAQFTVS